MKVSYSSLVCSVDYRGGICSVRMGMQAPRVVLSIFENFLYNQKDVSFVWCESCPLGVT